MGTKKITKFRLIFANYLWLSDQSRERGMSMNDVLNDLIAERRGQTGAKRVPKVASGERVQ